MAKKKDKEDETAGEVKMEDFVGRLRTELTKKYGAGICQSPKEILDRKLITVPWSTAFDMAIGGVPEGSFLSVAGMPKTGKTTSLLKLAANAQKLGKACFLLNVEGRFKKSNLEGTHGLDLSDDKFMVIESIPGRMLTTQDYMDIAETIIKTYPGCLIIIDSISSLADAKETEGGLGTQTRGNNSKVITQFITNNAQLVYSNRCIVAGILQMIFNTSGYGETRITKGPLKWTFQSDIILQVKSIDKWKSGSGDNEKIIGQIVNWEAKTSSLGMPYTQFESYLRYKHGVDDIFETMKCAESCGLINKSGAWYSLDYLKNCAEYLINEETPKKQGGENVWEFLKTEPNAYKILLEQIKNIS